MHRVRARGPLGREQPVPRRKHEAAAAIVGSLPVESDLHRPERPRVCVEGDEVRLPRRIHAADCHSVGRGAVPALELRDVTGANQRRQLQLRHIDLLVMRAVYKVKMTRMQMLEERTTKRPVAV